MDEDRIEKHVIIRAPRERVWTALTDSEEFGRWFGARCEGPFVAGRRVRMVIAASELASPEEIAGHPYLGKPMVLLIERLERPHRFSYRWQPLETGGDPEAPDAPTTLVEFTLEEVPDGTRLTVVETGFSRLPAAHRESAYKSHDGGWSVQIVRVGVHIEQG
jgi:uncharacterized protein YndB with AHSA1/START domain